MSSVSKLGTMENASRHQKAAQLLMDRFRLREDIVEFTIDPDLTHNSGYFRIGPNIIAYGQCSSGLPAKSPSLNLHDAGAHIVTNEQPVKLPFDPLQVMDNLLLERYHADEMRPETLNGLDRFRNIYYFLRPMLGVSVRSQLQKLYFRNWNKLPFPNWPVDVTIENICEHLLLLSMKSRQVERVPFIWFWPEGSPSCTMITHDVETLAGRDFCDKMMALNDSFEIKTAFQIIPEDRYAVSQTFLDAMRNRGYEINVHDLNHDGRLLSSRDMFLQRVARINRYGRQIGALGFRSGVMYRNVDWYDALEFSYDMSIPNVAHLEPQQGGCCTVMPFFIGKILELPLTTTQDYSLYNILGEFSIELWKRQISLIRAKHGLISFISHPDYNIDLRCRAVYIELLHYLSQLRSAGQTWIAQPREVSAWWRLRSELNLVKVGTRWHIEGKGCERARLAYAVLKNDAIVYELAPTCCD